MVSTNCEDFFFIFIVYSLPFSSRKKSCRKEKKKLSLYLHLIFKKENFEFINTSHKAQINLLVIYIIQWEVGNMVTTCFKGVGVH